MNNQFEIITNTGKKKVVSKEFADLFNEAKEKSKYLGEDFGQLKEVPIEEFEEDKMIEKSILGEYGEKVKDIIRGALSKPKSPNQIKGGLADKVTYQFECKSSH